MINSKEGKGFRWYSKNNCHVCGYAYVNNEYYECIELLEYFSGVKDESEFKIKIQDLNGVFAVIIKSEGNVFAAVDRYGVFRLFYCLTNKDLYIGDNAARIVESAGLTLINPEAERDWVYAGFAVMNETLIKGLMSLNASKFLSYYSRFGLLNIRRYHIFQQIPCNESYSELKSRLQIIFNETTKRLISSLGGKKALVPLSGGVDSRFIVMMLKEAGYNNVLCFTYGNRSGKEEVIARMTADAYGFDHIYIPYKCHEWRGLFRCKDNLEYIDFASQYKAVPHFSDLFAARYLSKKLNPSECLIIPGQIGTIAESYMKNGAKYTRDEFLMHLISKFFFYYGSNDAGVKAFLKERLKDYFITGYEADALNAQEVFDNAAYDTYRSGHVLMALKPYEFYGFDFRLPMMDNELVDFFKEVPLTAKGKNKILLSDFVMSFLEMKQGFYEPMGNYFSKVAKNLKDKRYCCINPIDVFKLRKNEYCLPGIHRVLYRYYRNYLSYAAAKTLHYILKKKDKEND